ncbi:sensor histidine kinase [Brevibacterium jeotgali]|uniref:Signal transduction histidine kinase n=1 Tax=Brevibacterium jeotgali TaxID=1262550 RepID=A0A2H1L861_9MICO|nr:histidine kinase [Brevibacterium jeotgali]TWC01596.1 signal transduction histidine kinase [Brevibacterium jeotgali]SMY13091.1 Signal transduction histidine kinase [Brevibacterium jeotgali]
MRRIGTDQWAGLAMLVLAVAVGAPVVLGIADPSIARAWWVVLYCVFLAALVVVSSTESQGWRSRAAFGVALLASWAVVLTSPGLGLVQIVLVITAAISVYIMPLWASSAVIGLNTAALAVVLLIQSATVADTIALLGFYLLIQCATVLSSATLLREMRLRRELTEAHTDLRAASVLLSASSRNAERLRISRELHDLIGHQLTVLTLELEAARHRPGERALEHIIRADGVARDLLADVRSTVGELRQGTADLAEALRGVVHGLPDLTVSVDVDPAVEVGEHQQVAFVRGVQEIVTNTLRHSGADRLRIDVTAEDEHTVLHAVDDGRGHPAPVPGNGLCGLHERFAELGGDVTVDGSDGFRVTARVPGP